MYYVMCRSHWPLWSGYHEEARQEWFGAHRELGGGFGEVCESPNDSGGEDIKLRSRDGSSATGVSKVLLMYCTPNAIINVYGRMYIRDMCMHSCMYVFMSAAYVCYLTLLYLLYLPCSSSIHHHTFMLLWSLDEQAVLLQQNTERDELFSQQTAASHRAMEKEQTAMGRMLSTHDKAIANDCVHRTAFSEVI